MDIKKIVVVGESKFDQVKRKLNDGAREVGRFCQNNKEWLIPLVPAVVGGGIAIVKRNATHRNIRATEKLQTMRCYDRSAGHYWDLRRKLSNAEWNLVNTRKANGEKLGDILDSMKVLR